MNGWIGGLNDGGVAAALAAAKVAICSPGEGSRPCPTACHSPRGPRAGVGITAYPGTGDGAGRRTTMRGG